MAVVETYIALGSNLDDPVRQIRTAILTLNNLPKAMITAQSSLYKSAPMGPADQPAYINAVIQLRTDREPLELLAELQLIEDAHERKRNAERWGPRTLDLDIILYGNLTLRSEKLTIPHYGLTERNFVLIPLFEIAPQLILPDGTALKLLVDNCSTEGLERLPA